MPDNPNLVPGQRIKLSTHINEPVRFKLHELADMKAVQSTNTATGLPLELSLHHWGSRPV